MTSFSARASAAALAAVGLAAAAAAQLPPPPAAPQAPKVVKWPGGYMILNGPEVIVRNTSPDGGSTNLVTGSGNGFGNRVAWWGEPAGDGVLTGSHLDSVLDGGAYDGPLGVVSAFAAIDLLRERGSRPLTPTTGGSSSWAGSRMGATSSARASRPTRTRRSWRRRARRISGWCSSRGS